MGLKKTIIRNVFSNWVGLGVNMVVGFFMLRFLVQNLGDTTYGLWILIGSVTGYFGLLDLGIRGSVGRYIAHYKARDDQDGVNATLNTTLVILSIVTVLVLIATAVLVVTFPFIFPKTPSSQIAAVRWALAIVGLNLAITFPLHVFDGVLWGFQRFDILNAIDVPVTLLRAGATVLLVSQGEGLIALAVITLVCTLIADLLKMFFSFREDRSLKLRPSFVTRRNSRELFGFGIWNFAISTSDRVINYTDVAIVGSFLGAALVTPYTIARRLVQYAISVRIATTGVLTPVATTINAKSELDRQKRLWVQGTRFCLVFALFFLTGVVFLGKDLIVLWVGSKYASSYPILVLLAVGAAVDMSMGMTGTILLGMARHKRLAFLRIIEAVANLVLSLLLVRPYGLMGVAAGTMIPRTLTGVFVYPWLVCRTLGLPMTTFLKQTVMRMVSWSVPGVLLGYCLWHYTGPEELPRLTIALIWMAKAFLLSIAFGLAFWFGCLAAQQRDQAFRWIRAKLGFTSRLSN